jgi:hypothetical protein
MDITLSPSPNHDERKHPVDMIVLHYTGMQTGQAAFDQLRNPDAKVSPITSSGRMGGWTSWSPRTAGPGMPGSPAGRATTI